MIYKIPIQIENKDPIFLGLSLTQLLIVMSGGGIGYSIFKYLSPLGIEIALIPTILIVGLFVLIAIFKYSQMNFIMFIIAVLRQNINIPERRWMKGVDSFSAMDLGYISSGENKKHKKVKVESRLEKMKKLEEKLKKI